MRTGMRRSALALLLVVVLLFAWAGVIALVLAGVISPLAALAVPLLAVVVFAITEPGAGRRERPARPFSQEESGSGG